MNMLISQIIIYWKMARKTATQKLKLKINKRQRKPKGQSRIKKNEKKWTTFVNGHFDSISHLSLGIEEGYKNPPTLKHSHE